jgi:hypothetical protein
MRKVLRIFGVLILLTGLTLADGVTNVASFQDGWGNTGGFWQVSVNGETYLVLKLRSKDKKGEADIVFTREQFDEFEENLRELKQAHNSLKRDGYEVGKTIHSGDAMQNTIFARINGVKVKTIQVIQTKNGEKRDHSLALSADSYKDIKLAIKKVRRELGWQ